MARILIVGCGCRGSELATALIDGGHVVRGTTRDPRRLEAVKAVCREAALADPNRPGTLLPPLEGVSVVCWLMGSASGTFESVGALHGPRLGSLLSKLVDTPVRGLVYEAAGTVDVELLAAGEALVRAAAEAYRMPARVVGERPERRARWLATMLSAVDELLDA